MTTSTADPTADHTPARSASSPDPAHAPARRAAVILLFVVLVIALVARTVFLIWEPPFTGTIDYDTIAPIGATYWTMHIYVSGPAFTLAWVSLAIFVALLARGRTTAVTLAAALLIGVGGIIFALVTTAEALPFAYAADPDVLPEAEGRALFDVLNAHLGLLGPTILGSQAVIAGGVLIALVVALVTRALPRWLSISGLIYLVAFVALPFELLGRSAIIASDLLQTLLVVGIGWFGMRAALGRTPR